jgi:hypothetical protein
MRRRRWAGDAALIVALWLAGLAVLLAGVYLTLAVLATML